MSGCVDAKALQKDVESLGFSTTLDKPKIGRRLGGEEPLIKRRGEMSQGDL